MVKLTGPMMSITASGTFAKTMTFAAWKGRAYSRQRVIPTNPKTASQLGVRAMMKFLATAWASIATLSKATYDAAAAARSISSYNQYISENLARWQMSKAPSQASPAAEASTPLTVTTQTLTGGEGHITVSITPSGSTNIWGLAIFRGSAEITAPGWSNCIAVVEADGANAVTYTDSPLDAGTYHYRTAVINDDGVLGTIHTDASATAT
jgi:hypothetical protein